MALEYYEVSGVLRNGSLVGVSRQAIGDALRRFPDGPVVVRIQVDRAQRSSQQNRYWHGVVIPLFAEHCGYDVADMKDALALTLIPKEVTDFKTGEVLTVPGHTSELNTREFADLIERAQRLGAEMGIYIPNPGEMAA